MSADAAKSSKPQPVSLTPGQIQKAIKRADAVYRYTGARAVMGALRALLLRVCPIVRAVTGRPLPVCPSNA